jgi:hypothetical protein
MGRFLHTKETDLGLRTLCPRVHSEMEWMGLRKLYLSRNTNPLIPLAYSSLILNPDKPLWSALVVALVEDGEGYEVYGCDASTCPTRSARFC